KRMADALHQFRAGWEKRWLEELGDYQFRVIKASDTRPDQVPDQVSLQRLKEFREDPEKMEDPQPLLSGGKYLYYGAVRPSPSCRGCHRQLTPGLEENDLLAVVKIEVGTDHIQKEIHENRALLISTALVTALLIMAGSYVIVRYVIVKPV